MKRRNVGILIFPDVEVLDFAGPFEVFSRTRLTPGVDSRRREDSAPFTVFTVAADREPLKATGGLQVTPDHGFGSHPPIDLLVVPGGFGTRPLLDAPTTLQWIAAQSGEAELTTSVCSGSLLLAKLGLLDGKRATSHWGSLDSLAQLGQGIDVQREARYVDDGVITSAGVSAGIDMAFYVVEKLHGRDVADETAQYIDYPRHR